MGDTDFVISDHDRRAYLLGTADLKTTHRIELELLRGSEELDRIERLEDELIDDYVFGRLPDEENLRFWDHFLCTPTRKSKLNVANELRLWAGSQPEDLSQLLSPGAGVSQSTWRMAIGIATCGLVALSIWLGVSNARLRMQLANGPRERIVQVRPDNESAPPNNQVASNTREPAMSETGVADRIAQATLVPGLTRSIQRAQVVRISPGALVVLLTLDTLNKPPSSGSRFSLFNADGRQIWSEDLSALGIPQGAYAQVIAIPTPILAAGDYQLRVAARSSKGAFEDLNSYSFRVVRN